MWLLSYGNHTLKSLTVTQAAAALADDSTRIQDSIVHSSLEISGPQCDVGAWEPQDTETAKEQSAEQKGYISVGQRERVLHFPVGHCLSITLLFIEL